MNQLTKVRTRQSVKESIVVPQASTSSESVKNHQCVYEKN